MNQENVAGAPGEALLKEEAGTESLETVHEEAKSQGDPRKKLWANGAGSGSGRFPVPRQSQPLLQFLHLPRRDIVRRPVQLPLVKCPESFGL